MTHKPIDKLQENSSSVSWVNRLEGWADEPPPVSFFPLKWLHKLLRIILITLREMETNRLSLRSGALTYAMLLSMVPMLAMSTAVVKGLGGGNQLKELVYQYIDTLERDAPNFQFTTKKNEPDQVGSQPALPAGEAGLPGDTVSEEETTPAEKETPPEEAASPQETEPAEESAPGEEETPPESSADLTSHLRSAADKIFNYVERTNFATLGTFGMLGIFLSVILVLGQIETAMNTIWHVRDGRSILRKITDYLTLMVLMPISINVALAAGTILGNESLTATINQFIPGAWIQLVLFNGVPILFLAATLYIIYIFFPNTKVRNIPTMIGAVLAGTLWFVTQNIYIGLQVGVAKYNAIYGSFATIPLFLVWIYFGWLFVLLGAQVAFAIQNCARYQIIERPIAPALQLSAALDLCSYVTSRFTEQQGSRLDDMAAAYPSYDPELLAQTRDTLVAAGIIHHSGESGELMPSSPPETISNHQIIETILGTEPPSTRGGKVAAKAVEAALRQFPEEQENPEADDVTVQESAAEQDPGPPQTV